MKNSIENILSVLMERTEAIEKRLEILVTGTKSLLCFDEAKKYLNVSASYLYKLTAKKDIPFYKPTGKRVYFKREDLDLWISRNLIKPAKQLESIALNLIEKRKSRKAKGISPNELKERSSDEE